MLYTNHNSADKFHSCLTEQYGSDFKQFQYLASEGKSAHYKATCKHDKQAYLFKLNYLAYEDFCTCYVYKVQIQKSKYQLEGLENDK